MPLTTIARTAVDVGLTPAAECRLAALDSALRMGATWRRSPTCWTLSGWPGAAAQRAGRDADGRAGEPGRILVPRGSDPNGLPPDDLQKALFDVDGLIGRGDFYRKGVVGEFDGRLKHALPEQADVDQAAQVLWTRSAVGTGCAWTTK